jgi:hypothetical protein
MKIEKFTAYETSTGKILFCGKAQNPQFLQSNTITILVGCEYEEGYFIQDKFYKLPAKPSDYHIFDYETKLWIDPRTPDTEWPLVRAKRDRLLQSSDWTQLPDVPLATKEAWATYRQALRDITEQPDPFNIVWPEIIF